MIVEFQQGQGPMQEILLKKYVSVQDCVIHARGLMSRDFPKVERHPKCMDHAILRGKPFGNCFIN
jgi:hypothetical protein